LSPFAVLLTAAALLSLLPDRVAADSASIAAGEQVYARCIGCHSPGRNRTGPLHCGLFGRESGTAPGYDYSIAMQAAKISWNAETLDQFLLSPTTAVPGTTMGFAGISNAKERRDLIAWLATLTEDSPLCKGALPRPNRN